MHAVPLSLDLRRLSALLSEHGRCGAALAPEACRRIAIMLGTAARQADELEARTVEAAELEDELLLVAGAAASEPAPSYQSALKAQQAEIQRQLDRGGPEPVSRPGLAALSVPFGNSNVVSFPRAPRPAGGDHGGDAA
ncbi:hypothetical protein [Bosea sp. (in: a-proteobacteria)]|uniref:hypothetical protein n=1 Tax=Bosea sp. (in: a-proteobacteria) TaxID=1871050 RepID=UPI001ACBFCC0|nr:hypothetical protein [Bosea sp. (in: a-proteobacteria)]MBN9438953.1 hypothetical protein [Bosea sp. (in: a-proteobacteria)]